MTKLISIKNLFLLNAIVELLGGLFIFLYPQFLLVGSTMTTESMAVSKMYSISIFLIGIVSYQCFKFYEEENNLYKMIFLGIATYHLLISFQLFGCFQIGVVTHLGPIILHLALSIILMFGYLRKVK